MPRGRRAVPIQDRFVKYYTKGSPDECWEWTGCKNNKGYGVITEGRKLSLSHRFALGLHLGRPILEGMSVLHSCDNPACVNPNHLREGTPQENMDDKMSRGRHVSWKRKLTWDQVADIRGRAYQTQTSLAKEFGVSQSTICFILNTDTWK